MGFRAVSALAIGKWIALAFGPAGTALFGQLMNLYSCFSSIPCDGLGRAVIKEGTLAEQAEKGSETQAIVSTSYFILGILFVLQWLITIVIACTTNWFSPFQESGLLPWLLLSFGTLAGIYFGSSIFLVWHKTKFQAITISALALGGLLGILLSYLAKFDINETLLSFMFGQSLGGLVVLIRGSGQLPAMRLKPIWNAPIAKKLLVFALAFSSTIFINQLGSYGLVHWAIDEMGTQKVGLWMAMNRISDIFNIPLLAIANSILLPLLASQAHNLTELRKTLSPVFKQSFVGLAVGLFLLFFLYPILLPLLYTKEFQTTSEWTTWQLAGDFFKSSTAVVAVLILALGHTRFYFWLETTSMAVILFLSWFLFHKFGFEGMFIAHFLRYSLYWSAIIWRYRAVLI